MFHPGYLNQSIHLGILSHDPYCPPTPTMTHVPIEEEILEQLSDVRTENLTIGMIKAVALIKGEDTD